MTDFSTLYERDPNRVSLDAPAAEAILARTDDVPDDASPEDLCRIETLLRERWREIAPDLAPPADVVERAIALARRVVG